MSTVGETIIQQLLEIYYNFENWHKKIMPNDEAYKYHQKLLAKGNIICHTKDGIVLGYIEVWCVNAQQFNKIKYNNFYPMNEETNKGTIGYLANCWIKEEYRNNGIYKILKDKFMEKTQHCNFFAGEEQKRGARMRMFRRMGG